MATTNTSAEKAQKKLKKIESAQKKAAKAQVKADKLQKKADKTQKKVVRQGAVENMMVFAAMLGMVILAIAAATIGTGDGDATDTAKEEA